MTTTRFVNCRACIDGRLVPSEFTFSREGFILENDDSSQKSEIIDLDNAILAPGFIELQTNGALGFHFAHQKPHAEYKAGVEKLAKYLPSTGVTGFFPTVPTVPSEVFKEVLPHLRPQDFDGGASVLGSHVEGPFIAPSKKGAHDASNMHIPSEKTLEEIYGEDNLRHSIKVLTLAPELPGALQHVERLKKEYGIHVSMGHSAATHEEGKAGLNVGANLLTHTFNAMNPLHHREPGLPGLITLPFPPYYSLIADSIHLHPSMITLSYRTSPSHTILITDSIELSGLPDGVYPGHAQIPHSQLKVGNKVTIAGTETLIGTCIGLDECVRNLMRWAGIEVQEAVRCVTENVAMAVGLRDRARLEAGRRADFVVVNEEGVVLQTWVMGKKVFDRTGQ